MKKIIIIGTGGHSKVVSDEIEKLKKFRIIGFIDKKKNIGSKPIAFTEAKVIGRLNNLKKLYKKNYYLFIAIGDNYVRKKVYNDIQKLNLSEKWATIMSKDSVISKNAKILNGTLIISGSIINANTYVGNHCIISTGCKIDHDNYFDDFSSCGPNVTTGGNVTINTLSYIGISSTIKHKIKIFSNTIIGAKSYVNKNCKSNNVYFGTPAKKIRTRKIGEKYL